MGGEKGAGWANLPDYEAAWVIRVGEGVRGFGVLMEFVGLVSVNPGPLGPGGGSVGPSATHDEPGPWGGRRGATDPAG